MLTGICISGIAVGVGALWLVRRDKTNLACALLNGYVFVIAFLSSGPLLTEIGKTGQDVSNFLSRVGQMLPR